MTPEQQAMWAEMAELTLSKCKTHCHNLGSCCSYEYCEQAMGFMRKAGGEPPPEKPWTRHETNGMMVPPTPQLDENGKCLIPPHFRPICTVHQCKIASVACDPKDPEWTEKYFILRERLEETVSEFG